MTRTLTRSAALILPLLLVNSAAVYGQAGWAHDHLTSAWPLAFLFAASIESIGIYLAYEAHAALMAGDASARLRLGSYLVGILAGSLNYAHFASTGYRPNPLAVTFGVLSSISPWLWSIRSRSMNRAHLRELGQIDPRAVRFSLLRWALFPVRCFRAFRGAVWAGIVEPTRAVELADARRGRVPVTVAVSRPELTAGPAGDGEIFALAALTQSTQEATVPAVEVSDIVSDTTSSGDQPKRTRRPLTTAERITRLRERQPDLAASVIAKRIGVTERTVSRHLAALVAEANGIDMPDLAMSDTRPINGAELAEVT